MKTKIEWAEQTWNPVTGCTKISPGCLNCYAQRMAQRLKGRFGYDLEDPFRVTEHPDRYDEPLKLSKPSIIFVCSMGDLFHDDVPTEWIRKVFGIASRLPEKGVRHKYLFLTKRPARMREELLEWIYKSKGFRSRIPANWWIGVTAEDQKRWDYRVAVLSTIPAKVRWVSVEPMLERIETGSLIHEVDWIVAGSESGPGARFTDSGIYDFEDLLNQCRNNLVPFFFKQYSWIRYEDKKRILEKMPKLCGRVWNQYPVKKSRVLNVYRQGATK